MTPGLNKIITILFAFLLLTGCSKRPDGVLSEKEMVQLMADLKIAEAYTLNGNPGKLPDSVKALLSEAILAKRGVSYAQLDSTLKWYGRNMDDFFDLHDKVEKEITQRAIKSGDHLENDINNSNLWRLNDHLYFSSFSLSDGLTFSLPNPGVVKGESLKWSVRLSSPVDTKMYLGADYDDGSYTINSSSNYGSRNLQCELFTDTGKVVKRIFGNIRIRHRHTPLWADSIRLSKFPYDSIDYYKMNTQRMARY
ncbi:MAG: DUF4296 domain-containing protein [Muribaculaceae bacterium]|nr:DUF4296 domain-containing protein [Muribaculaceae bacterium]